MIIESGDQATYAEWKAFEPFVFAIPEGQSVRFRVMDTEGREVYVSDGYILESSDLNASIQLSPALFGQMADFALVGMSPANGSVDVSTRSPIILRFSNEIDRSRPIEIEVRANGLDAVMNPRVEYDRFGLATLVTLYHSDAPFEPDATYTITIGTLYDVHGRLYSDNRLLQFTTGVGTDDSYDLDADGLYDPSDLDERLAEIEASLPAPSSQSRAHQRYLLIRRPIKANGCRNHQLQMTKRRILSSRMNRFGPSNRSTASRTISGPEVQKQRPVMGDQAPLGELIAGLEPTMMVVCALGRRLLPVSTGRYDTLIIYLCYQFESGRKYTVQLVEISMPGTASTAMSPMWSNTSFAHMFDASTTASQILRSLDVIGSRFQSDRSFANESFRVNDGGRDDRYGRKDFNLRRSWFDQSEEERGAWFGNTAGYLPVLKVEKMVMLPGSAGTDVLRAYDVTLALVNSHSLEPAADVDAGRDVGFMDYGMISIG